jgi:hypothetical protein
VGRIFPPPDPGPEPALPNLTVEGLSVSTRPDGRVAVSGRVANAGLAPVPRNTFLDVSYAIPEQVGEVVASRGIDPLPPGGRSSFDVEVPAGKLPASRNLRLWVTSDARNVVPESEENDNTVERTIVYGLDLEVVGLKKVGDDLDPAGRSKVLVLDALVRNRGTVESGHTATQWEEYDVFGSEPGRSWTAIEHSQVSLAPGEEVHLKLRIDGSTGRVKSRRVMVRLLIDPDDRRAELDKKNNSMGVEHEFLVDLPPPVHRFYPDVAVRDVQATYDPEKRVVMLRALLANEGAAETGPFQIEWTRPTASQQAATISGLIDHPSIAPSQVEAQPTEFVWSPPAELAGTMVPIQFGADRANRVPEAPSTRDNNFRSLLLKIPGSTGADLAVIRLEARTGDGGRMILVSGTITNLGNQASGPWSARWALDDTPVGEAGVESQTGTAPGQSYEFGNLSLSITDEMRRRRATKVTLTVEPRGPDLDPSNNQKTIAHGLEAGADLAVTNVSAGLERIAQAAGPELATALVVTATVANLGDGPSSAYAYKLTVPELAREEGNDGAVSIQPGESRTHELRHILRNEELGKTIVATMSISPSEQDLNPENNAANSQPLSIPGLDNGPLPDLSVESMDRRANAEGITAAIVNRGEGRSPGFEIVWYMNGKEAHRETAQGLEPGERHDTEIPDQIVAGAWSSGLHVQLTVVVDPAGLIPETDKTNNSRSHDMKGPDEVPPRGDPSEGQTE